MSFTFKFVLYGLITLLTTTTGEFTELVGLTTEENGFAWIQAFQCTENQQFTYNAPFNDMAGFIEYAQYAKSIKFVSSDQSVNIYAQECNNQILALNKGYDMSCQIDTSTDLISGFSNKGSFVGDTNFMGNSCTSSCGYNGGNFGQPPITLDKILFDSGACGSTRPGVHIKPENLICRVNDGNQKTINVFLGFDPQLSVDCSGNSIPYPKPKTRDCSVLAIDDFLLECSTEFETQTTDIQGLKDQIAAMDNKLENAGDDIEINGKTLSTVVTDLQSDIDACEGRLDLFAAQSIQNKMNIDSENNTQMLSFIGMKLSDILIVVLLCVNLMVISYIHCYRGSKGGRIVVKQYDPDEENNE